MAIFGAVLLPSGASLNTRSHQSWPIPCWQRGEKRLKCPPARFSGLSLSRSPEMRNRSHLDAPAPGCGEFTGWIQSGAEVRTGCMVGLVLLCLSLPTTQLSLSPFGTIPKSAVYQHHHSPPYIPTRDNLTRGRLTFRTQVGRQGPYLEHFRRDRKRKKFRCLQVSCHPEALLAAGKWKRFLVGEGGVFTQCGYQA
ncbi:hypothetical protein JOL62DRAFT_270925 [Phyllosticta paracitricarpa]|uniref:Uncharacterized protein n=1 Tax=Phyllosticta paracitricarpa TaxID=2016321 RepID=A0ABR1MZG6_9PEZI